MEISFTLDGGELTMTLRFNGIVTVRHSVSTPDGWDESWTPSEKQLGFIDALGYNALSFRILLANVFNAGVESMRMEVERVLDKHMMKG